MNNIVWGIVIGVLIVIGIIFFVNIDNSKNIIKPPIGITFREGFTGGVMQVHNTSSNRQMCHLSVYNDEYNQEKHFSFSVQPNGIKEIGVLEMDWHFDPGEYGHIKVDGYVGAIYFTIKSINKKSYTSEWKLKK
ncbi:MAG: hypothetical protein IJW31_02160 [Lentisphaeria bacterium]|nr:hypothetical protein [Lentisphaeria bacterium]